MTREDIDIFEQAIWPPVITWPGREPETAGRTQAQQEELIGAWKRLKQELGVREYER